MVYINIFWHKNDSIIMRGYKTKESAIEDTCDINDLYYIYDNNFTVNDYFECSTRWRRF